MVLVTFNTCITNITFTIKNFHNKTDLTDTKLDDLCTDSMKTASGWSGSQYTKFHYTNYQEHVEFAVKLKSENKRNVHTYVYIDMQSCMISVTLNTSVEHLTFTINSYDNK
jgi:hypothetical protein